MKICENMNTELRWRFLAEVQVNRDTAEQFGPDNKRRWITGAIQRLGPTYSDFSRWLDRSPSWESNGKEFKSIPRLAVDNDYYANTALIACNLVRGGDIAIVLVESSPIDVSMPEYYKTIRDRNAMLEERRNAKRALLSKPKLTKNDVREICGFDRLNDPNVEKVEVDARACRDAKRLLEEQIEADRDERNCII